MPEPILVKATFLEPEPPKPEPPKPEPPKPEPPKPEPPKPEQPKPKPEPPKPEPPKPEPPKPEQAKTSSLDELRKRFESAKTVQVKPSPQRSSTSSADIQRRLSKNMASVSSPTVAVPVSQASQTQRQEEANYADLVVRPHITRYWRQPMPGELDRSRVTPVEISFTVFANGTVTGKRIVTPSNSQVMNRSAQAFLDELTRLQPLSAIGSKAASLHIVATLALKQ